MTNDFKQLILIGGGASISEGIDKGLWTKITDKWTMGLNYSFKYFINPTCQVYVDQDFYEKQKPELTKLALIIGKEHRQNVLNNTITLPTAIRYTRDLSGGVYSPDLCGLFALSLAIYLLDEGEISLLGFDFGEARKANFEDKTLNEIPNGNDYTEKDHKNRYKTHFYQGDLEHRGVGKTSYYNCTGRARNKWSVYKNEKRVKIYNVSLNSRIPGDIFEKISYDEFFDKLNDKKYNQDEIRRYIRKKLNS